MVWRLYVLTLFVALAVSENPEENAGLDDPDLFEGDMILTTEQRMAAEMGLDVDNPFGRGSTEGRQWPGGLVPYVIDSELARYPKAMAAVNEAISEWTSKTCIRFKKRTNELAFVNFRGGGFSRCSSYVGRTGTQQDIHLSQGCWKMGIVAHEIGHALGFYHEQSRPDRDDYITIMWDNIIGAKRHNFAKYGRGTINSLGTKYDYGSLMHYPSKAFSKNKQPTIVAKKPGVTFGQRERISVIDAEQMNLLYKTQCEEGAGGGGGGGDGGSSDCKDAAYGCAMWICTFKPDMAKKSCKKTCGLC